MTKTLRTAMWTTLTVVIAILLDIKLDDVFVDYSPFRLWVMLPFLAVVLIMLKDFAVPKQTRAIIRQITLTGMLIAMGIVLERFLAIPIGATNRIAFGTAIVVVSSLIVGPFYGAIVGASVDILGFMISNLNGGAYTPFVTIGYLVLGFLPYFLVELFKLLRHVPFKPFIFYGTLSALFIYGVSYAYTHDSFLFRNGATLVTVTIDGWYRIVAPLVFIAVFAAFAWFLQQLNRQFNRRTLLVSAPNPSEITIALFVTDILVNILWGAVWRSIYFGSDVLAFFFIQTGFFIIGFPIKALLVNYGYQAYLRFQSGASK